jgi:DNA-binding response OmpR family regulator
VSPNASEGARILVADDDPDILNLVRVRLKQAGYETLGASDGEEALRLALEHRPALCILDVVMPKRNGFEVLEALRRTERTADLPVMLLTATVEEREMARGFESGADAYLTKPFSPSDLLDRVRTLLARR